jgi:uncharacterized protein YaeQ
VTTADVRIALTRGVVAPDDPRSFDDVETEATSEGWIHIPTTDALGALP